MKYYCKNCENTWEPGKRNGDIRYDLMACPFCKGGEVERHFDYETPEQYEKRTGKSYPNDWLVFNLQLGHWYPCDYQRIKEGRLVVIADSPVPPPDDWRPE